MLNRHGKHVRRAAGMITKLAGLMSLSVLTGGCMFLPFGGGSSSTSDMPRSEAALRPEIHEVAANVESDCLAQDETIESDSNEAEAELRKESQLPAQAALAQVDATANAPLILTASASAPACADCGCKAAGDTARASQTSAADQADVARAQVQTSPVMPAPAGPAGFSPARAGEDVLQRLMDGNKRFVEGESENTYQWSSRPGVLGQGNDHAPRAMILACSDWQTLPEAAFDSTPGELYVVRVAGNMADDAVIHSAKFALQRYNIPLIIVLGHEGCGAINAGVNLDIDAAEGEPASHKIGPEKAIDEQRAADKSAESIRGNVDDAVRHLSHDGALANSIAAGRLRVMGAYYDETNGQVTLQPQAAIAPAASEYVNLPKD